MKLLREPLFHFIIAGALLFAGYEWLNRGKQQPEASEPVRIGEGEARWLRETFASQWRRQPTADEFNGLLATLVNEAVLAREARALGLDQDDTIVRRRLAQKLTFLIEDTARIAEHGRGRADRRYYAAHAQLYSTQPLVSFRHVFFSPQRRPDAEADARQALAALDAPTRPASRPFGDALIIADSFNEIDTQAVSSLFGPAFARDLFGSSAGLVERAVESSFGVHLVEVTFKREAEPRRFEDVRQTVADDWRRQRMPTRRRLISPGFAKNTAS